MSSPSRSHTDTPNRSDLARRIRNQLPADVARDFDALLADLQRLEEALRGINTSAQLPDPFDPAEWWKHVASKRLEIARAALAAVRKETE